MNLEIYISNRVSTLSSQWNLINHYFFNGHQMVILKDYSQMQICYKRLLILKLEDVPVVVEN